SGHRWKKSDFRAFAQWRCFLRHRLIDGCANPLDLAKRGSPGFATANQPGTQLGHGGNRRRNIDDFAVAVHRLTQAREIEHRELHRCNSANGRYCTTSPRLIGRSGGLSTMPSAQTHDVNTAEFWFGNRSRPPASLTRTRKNSRRWSGFGTSKSARAGTRGG